jgi:tRNA U55 pseudouridine synthase TruB
MLRPPLLAICRDRGASKDDISNDRYRSDPDNTTYHCASDCSAGTSIRELLEHVGAVVGVSEPEKEPSGD